MELEKCNLVFDPPQPFHKSCGFYDLRDYTVAGTGHRLTIEYDWPCRRLYGYGGKEAISILQHHLLCQEAEERAHVVTDRVTQENISNLEQIKEAYTMSKTLKSTLDLRSWFKIETLQLRNIPFRLRVVLPASKQPLVLDIQNCCCIELVADHPIPEIAHGNIINSLVEVSNAIAIHARTRIFLSNIRRLKKSGSSCIHQTNSIIDIHAFCQTGEITIECVSDAHLAEMQEYITTLRAHGSFDYVLSLNRIHVFSEAFASCTLE